MSQLSNIIDLTGSMSPVEINSQNINNIIQELNRNSDQLDTLNQTLQIVAYGTLKYDWNGTGSGATPTQVTLDTGIQTTGNYIGTSFLSRNVDSPTIYISMPYFRNIVNGAGDAVLDKLFIGEVDATSGVYEVNLNFYATGSPISYTFYYFVYQQPSSVSQ